MTKKSYLFLALVALAAVLALSACGSSNNNNNASGSPSASAPSGSAAAGGGATKEITVNAKSFEFDQQDIQLHAGDTVKLTLNNTDGMHGLEIPDLGVNIKGGETATFTVDKAGTYAFNCSVQCGSGHDNMTGTITVS